MAFTAAVAFVGDRIDLADRTDFDDLTDPWLRLCDFLRATATGDNGDGCLGFGNLASCGSESFALLIASCGWKACSVS